MSLVGSLEDLGLGDILQIVALSQKSGLLLLRSDEGEGRIVFRDGLVRAASVKGAAGGLRALLASESGVDADAFESATQQARDEGVPLRSALADSADLAPDRFDALCRQSTETAVFRMFAWRTGEFSFEVRDEVESDDRPFLLESGISAQYLIMESTRLDDEGDRVAEPAPPELAFDGEADGDELFFSGESAGPGDAPAAPEPVPVAIADAAPAFPDPLPDAIAAERPAPPPAPMPAARPAPRPRPEAVETLALATAARVDGGAGAAPESPPASSLVVVDPDLHALEWIKASLAPLFRRIHIFQRPESGVARVRQYLGRGETPAVLLSSNVPPDPLSGARDAAELAGRLHGLAPGMPLFAMHPASAEAPSIPSVRVVTPRPPGFQLSQRRHWSKLEPEAERLREALRPHLSTAPPASEPRRSAAPAASLRRLKEVSDRLRDPSAQGDVLSLVLEFAAESFARVAIFMLRDDVAIGMAQRGLDRDGGPDDESFRGIEVPASEPDCFRAVIGGGGAFLGPLTGEGDDALAGRLGSSRPAEVYVAPIESGGHTVALLYADNGDRGAPIGDTTVVEVVLHEVGLALERAVLERALAAAESDVR